MCNAGKVRRVLWVEDNPENEAQNLFQSSETRNVRTMDDALKEISGPHLYDYDTIVFDIDFENGVNDADQVIDKLAEKIYLDEGQKTRDFIIVNGGYLLFIYLMANGYPIDHVAFLTGNGRMVKELKAYNDRMNADLSKEEIASEIKKIWDDIDPTIDDSWVEFSDQINDMPIDSCYKNEDFIDECIKYLEEEDFTGLTEYIKSVQSSNVSDENNIKNTGDVMMYRFHEANLEAPEFFTKGIDDINGHNKSDAKEWLDKLRSDENQARWLIMYAGHYIKTQFESNVDGMKSQVRQLFRENNGDPGIWTAFTQMYKMFYGLRDRSQNRNRANGSYYLAISAMLVPFDAEVGTFPRDARQDEGPDNDQAIRRMFAMFSKQSRNFSAHNYFGNTVGYQTALFIMMGTVAAVLSKEQRSAINIWFNSTKDLLINHCEYSCEKNIQKINGLIDQLKDAEKIDFNRSFHGSIDETKRGDQYSAKDAVRILGYNEDMSVKSQSSTSVREEYFKFVLAAYIVKWFDEVPENEVQKSEVQKKYGNEVLNIYQIANEIVGEYEYRAQ